MGKVDKNRRVYVAAGWFNPKQLEACRELEGVANSFFDVSFQPRIHNKGDETTVDWDKIFKANIEHLKTADLVIASTVGKDMGTIWECGYAFAAGIPIIYYTPGIKNVNLMLSKSGVVFNELDDLINYLETGEKGNQDHEIQ